MKPITPDEVVKKKQESLPEEVIEAANELIAEQWNGSRSHFTLNDLVNRIISKWKGHYDSPKSLRSHLFAKKYLDIEGVFRAAGWDVEFDNPGYNETYEPNFTFTRKMKSV